MTKTTTDGAITLAASLESATADRMATLNGIYKHLQQQLFYGDKQAAADELEQQAADIVELARDLRRAYSHLVY